MVEILTKVRYDCLTQHNKYWNVGASRWGYHALAIDILQRQIAKGAIKQPSDVLEIGTMGLQVVQNSDTMDIHNHIWQSPAPTIEHDAKCVPWPILDKRYEMLIALRVWQHLYPMQEAALKNAFRVSRRVLMVIPEQYPNGHGMPKQVLIDIAGEPDIILCGVFGEVTNLYYWDKSNG